MKVRFNLKRSARLFGHYWVAGMFLAFMGGLLLQLSMLPGMLASHYMEKAEHGHGGVVILGNIVSSILILLTPFLFGWLLHKAIINFSPMRTLFISWMRDVEEIE